MRRPTSGELMALFVFPAVFALRHEKALYFTFLMAALGLWAFGGPWGHWLGTVSCVAAITVSSLGLGASLERAGAVRGRPR